MTDRELLEAAARSAGIELGPWMDRQQSFYRLGDHSGLAHWWNPLTDDGDALRLAVKLQLAVDCGSISPGRQRTFVGGPAGYLADEAHGDDANAATRRAIVTAAARMTTCDLS